MAFVECNLCCDNICNGCTLTATSGASLVKRTVTTVHFVWPPQYCRPTDKCDSRVRQAIAGQLAVGVFQILQQFLGFSSKVVTVLATTVGHQRPTGQPSPVTAVTLHRLQQIL